MKSCRGLFAILLVSTLFGTTASAQAVTWPQRKPWANQPYEQYSQMWNANSGAWYFGTITFAAGSGVPNSSNYGKQLDSSVGGGQLTLSTSRITAGKVNADTVILQSLPGYGDVVLTGSVLQAGASTPTVTVRVMSSSNGWDWAVASDVDTLVATDLVVPVTVKYKITAPLDRFYALLFIGDGDNTYAAYASWYFQRVYGINLQK